jgi:hypothetical protein
MARIFAIIIFIAAVGIAAACDEVKDHPLQCKLDLMMANGKVVTITIDKDYYEGLFPGMEIELESTHFKGKKNFRVEWHEYANEKEHSHIWRNNVIQLSEKGYKPRRKVIEIQKKEAEEMGE